VSGRQPLWERREHQPVVIGLSTSKREVLVTHVMDAEPDHRRKSPEPSIWPFVTALAVTVLFVSSIFTPWAVVYGSVPVAVAMTVWFWPREGKRPGALAREIAAGHATPTEQTT
jgi:cytochrome c oxidase subunit 1